MLMHTTTTLRDTHIAQNMHTRTHTYTYTNRDRKVNFPKLFLFFLFFCRQDSARARSQRECLPAANWTTFCMTGRLPELFKPSIMSLSTANSVPFHDKVVKAMPKGRHAQYLRIKRHRLAETSCASFHFLSFNPSVRTPIPSAVAVR